MSVYNDQLSNYIGEMFAEEDEALRWARQDSLDHGLPEIGVKPEEGRFLQVLVRACGARRAVEIGSLGGYSGIWIARGLAPGGWLITLEKEPDRARLAREHFAAAGLAGQVEVREGDALRLLDRLGNEGPFDFVFIDADKGGYPAYFDWALKFTRQGGVIAAHNAFRKGSVAGLADPDDWTEVMRGFNQRVASEPRVFSTIYPAGDGTLVAVKIR
jgi:caffeoyl-CoA O-methyltransferase